MFLCVCVLVCPFVCSVFQNLKADYLAIYQTDLDAIKYIIQLVKAVPAVQFVFLDCS